MNGSRYRLDELQKWMQAVVMHPAGIEQGIASEQTAGQSEVSVASLEQIVTRSQDLTAGQRLSIYNRAYFARLTDCLRAQYPCLSHALGDGPFQRFALQYLRDYPSQDYTLSHLGRDFPRFLAETRPGVDFTAQSREPWPDFLIDLATLERAIFEVYDGRGVEHQQLPTADALLGVTARQLAEYKVTIVPPLQLFEFSYPVARYLLAIRKIGAAEIPLPTRSWIALTRQDYRVRLWDLTHAQYQLLQQLAAGQSVGAASRAVADVLKSPPIELAVATRAWLCHWADDGFFCQIGCFSRG